jgi:phage tail sheath protein FI
MVTLTSPGVYIQEVPSGVHTITGVSTSIAAFFGRTAKGTAAPIVMWSVWPPARKPLMSSCRTWPVATS